MYLCSNEIQERGVRHWNNADLDEVIEEDEVERAIEKMKTRNAPGQNNIVGEFVKYFPNTF